MIFFEFKEAILSHFLFQYRTFTCKRTLCLFYVKLPSFLPKIEEILEQRLPTL